jgi:hypothetical protein
MLKITLHEAKNFEQSQITKLETCLKLIQMAVNTFRFEEEVKNFTYAPVYSTGRAWWRKTYTGKPVKQFYFSEGEHIYTNQQVYDRIMTGWEENEQINDGEMDLYLTIKRSRWSSATAFGMPMDDMITIYSWWFNSAEIPSLCNTIFHEWLHNQIFEHDFNYNVCRDYSVPYAVGQILENIIRKGLESGEMKP